jgi:hypothetical protein
MISTAAYFKGVERLQTLQQFIVRTSSNSWTLFEHKLADPDELAFKKFLAIAAAEETYPSCVIN